MFKMYRRWKRKRAARRMARRMAEQVASHFIATMLTQAAKEHMELVKSSQELELDKDENL